MSNRETMDRRPPPATVTAVLLAVLLAPSAGFGTVPAEAMIDNSRFVYSIEEKLGFDLEGYLRHAAPHLLPHAEVISHWSAYYTVSPRLVLSLMELQTGQISDGASGSSERPFGALSAASTLNEQIQDVLDRLSRLFYESRAGGDGLRVAPAAREALVGLLGSDAAVAKLRSNYELLFPAARPLDERAEGLAPDKALPPPGYLQLPYPVGDAWYFGGTHSNTGEDQDPKSSLDFTRGEGWGDNTRDAWVVAAHGGTAIVYSSCFVEVVGANGWSTMYYHLDNVVVATGQTVGWDQRLANYADNLPQSICNGGRSTGPHVHFSLLRNSQFFHLQNVQLSRYRVHAGRFSYDSDCRFAWLERGGVRYCPWTQPLLNDGGAGVVRRPAAPEDLIARGRSTSEIHLGWSDRSDGESGFQIERRSLGGSFQRIATTGADATSYVDAGLASGSTYAYRVRAVNSAGSSDYSGEARATTSIEDPEPCVAAGDRLCLDGERFTVEVDWRDHNGNIGRGRTVPFAAADSGLLWFFAADNWEMLIKVLDGCGLNDRFWVFAAATTDVEYTLTVVDSLSGHVATYFNALGNASAAITDTEALAACGADGTGSEPRPAEFRSPAAARADGGADPLASCTSGPTNLCLAGERFQVEVEWQDFNGATGSGRVVPFGSADSGLFWFFAEDNWEMLVKVLDGCSFNDHFWVFSAATTNVGYTLRVTDTATGEIREWVNPLGTAAPALTATTAFAACE